jgi:hypothetical protein
MSVDADHFFATSTEREPLYRSFAIHSAGLRLSVSQLRRFRHASRTLLERGGMLSPDAGRLCIRSVIAVNSVRLRRFSRMLRDPRIHPGRP